MDPGNQKKKRKDMGPPSKTRSLISKSPPSKRRRLLNMDSVSTQGASSSSSPSSSHSLTYDVFLSIRSEDRGSKFARKLHRDLVGKGMNTFNHRDQDPEGHAKAIEESSSFIVVLSKNYAYSKSCLDELVHILECKKSKQQLVWPIFYKVDPFLVEYQKGSFRTALAKLGKFKNNREKVSRWRRALSEVANLSGWTFTSGSPSKFIDSIIEQILAQSLRHTNLKRTYLPVAKHPVGIESRIQDMLKLLEVGKSDVRMVGILGTGGIGKTTVAKAVYNSIAYRFHGGCFLANIGDVEKFKRCEGLSILQTILLSKILGSKVNVTDVDQGITLIKERLRHKRVVLILDNVNHPDQLNKLVGGLDWFGSGSRVIITTRYRNLLVAHQVNRIYTVNKLNRDEAMQLFCWNAFRGRLDDIYLPLAQVAVHHAQGIPLALVVLGSCLYGESCYEWTDVLDNLKRVVDRKQVTQEILKICYNALEDSVKEVFLQIACSFDEQKQKNLMKKLAGFVPNLMHGIQVLTEKAFINIGASHVPIMHELLKEMATELVRQKSANKLPKHSKFWILRDCCVYRPKNSAVHIAKDIMKKCSKPHEIPFSTTELAEFWSKNSMHGSLMSRRVEGFKIFKNLTSINFESCQFLKVFPDASGLPNLRNLNLDCCTSLVKIDDSVGFLEKLVDLSLSGCHNLIMFPRRIALKSVENIHFRGCRRLETLPEIVGEMELLTWLDLSGTAIKEVPSTIGYLINLEELILRECQKLTNLPCCIYELQHLWCLDLQYYCSNLVMLPRWNAESLPTKSSISPDLWYLNLRGCKRLQEIPELPPKVQWVNAADCVQLGRFAKLSNILERKESEMIKCLLLSNCQTLRDNLAHDVAKLGRNLLNEANLCSLFLSCTQSEFEVLFPGNEVPRWFSHRKHLNVLETSEVSFEIPQSFKLGNKGLAICAAVAVETTTAKEKDVMQSNLGDCTFTAKIDINGESTVTRSFSFESKDVASAHVWLFYMPFIVFAYRQLPPLKCQVHVEHISQGSIRCKSYGVHVVIPHDHDEDEDEDEDGEGLENKNI